MNKTNKTVALGIESETSLTLSTSDINLTLNPNSTTTFSDPTTIPVRTWSNYGGFSVRCVAI